jgi:hypothetical protein
LILKEWLGGLDSNQDSQSQSLESYQLDDLPAGRNKKESRHVRISRQPRFNLSNLIGNVRGVNRAVAMDFRPIAKLLTPGQVGHCGAVPLQENYGAASAGDFVGAGFATAGTIWPFSILNCSPPQWMRLEAKLASQTAK